VAVNNPRNRILIFRLTQDEYLALQAASSGARSLSDFARSKLLNSIEEPALNQQITDLNSKVERITELLERTS
jgi:hypothetical protein